MIWLHKRGSWPEEIGFTLALVSPLCAMTTSWKEVTNYLNWVYTEIEIALVSYYHDAWLVSVIGATLSNQSDPKTEQIAPRSLAFPRV